MGIVRRPDSKFWWLHLERPGRPGLRESTKIPVAGATRKQTAENRRLAEAAYAARMGDLARARYQLPAQTSAQTVDAFAAWYLTHQVPKHAGAEREREILKTLRAAFGARWLHELTRKHVEEWQTARVATGVSPRTVNRETDLLKALLRTAVVLGDLASSPLVGMPLLRVVQPKRRLMTHGEERRLLRAARDPVDRALLILGVDTLIRLGDLLDLQRSDRRGAWLYVRDPKDPVQSAPYEVPLTRRAAAALDRVPATGPYYFAKFRVAPTQWERRRDVRLMLARLCRRAGVPYGRKREGLTWHWSTRRTGATRLLVDRRLPLPTVQQLGHWKDPAVVLEIYAEASRKDLLAAVRGTRPRHAAPQHARKRA